MGQGSIKKRKLRRSKILLMVLFFCTLVINVFADDRFCPYCGKENAPDAKFCGYCDQELAREKGPKIKHYGIGIGYGQDLSADDSLSLSLYLDYVSDSGLGWQINLAVYRKFSGSLDSGFSFPVVIKYQLQKASRISPYFGIGLSYGWCDYLDCSNHPYLVEEWEGFVPVFCEGITFFSNSSIQLTCDGKYFLNPDLSKASAFFLSGLVSVNW